MVKRHVGSGPRKRHRSSTARGAGRRPDREPDSAGHAYGVPVPEGLHEAIEAERGNLAKAEAVLGCLAIAMEYETDSAAGPYYPDVALIARDIVRQSINGLDSLTLQRHLLRNKIKEDCDLPMIGGSCFLSGRIASSYPGPCRYRRCLPGAKPSPAAVH